VCPSVQNCIGGLCVCPTAGQILCSGQCVDPSSDQNNCGFCGNRCGPSQFCSNGSCINGG
jgi:hypothetical protein